MMPTDEIIRLSQTLFVFYIGAFAASVTLNNITDYGSNRRFVQHVMSMDTVFADSKLKWRAVTTPWIQAALYVLIIVLEGLTALLCLGGTWHMAQALGESADAFHAAKTWAFAGLALGFTIWFAIFMIGAGQWWASWQSKDFNGQDAAFRFYTPIGLVFLVLLHRV
jgi:predicted small integral membrane protein